MKRRLVALWSLMVSFSAAAPEIPFEHAAEFPAQAYDLIAEKRVVWLGEMHGTKEAPELLLGWVKLIARHHAAAPVVALEIPTSDQAAIDGYLASGADSRLRASAFFKSEFKDGRSSQALVRLLSQLRTEKIARVVCFDPTDARSAQARDTRMAENLLACAARFPAAKLVVLSGNIHSRIVAGTDWDPTYRPAAFELTRKLSAVTSFSIAFEAGTAWVRTEEGFSERPMKGTPWQGTASHYIILYPEPVGGHHGVVFTRTLTGSPPW